MLIKDLEDEPNYFMLKYNERNNRTGVYIPPHRLRRFQKQLEQEESFKNDARQVQRKEWELLRKSLTGIINKVNPANIEYVVIELLGEDLLWGKGLLAGRIVKAQMASINFSNVYAALVAVLNSKLPEIGDLVIRRVILQFRRSYQRSDRLSCNACLRFIAHLINQRVLNHFLGLQLVVFFLETGGDDAVELVCLFLQEAGLALQELCASGVYSIFEKLKLLLHEGQASRRVQYSIERLFKVRKNKWAEFPDIAPELDLLDEDSRMTHSFDLDDDEISGETELNIFMFRKDHQAKEAEWTEIKEEILGEDNLIGLKQPRQYIELEDEEPEDGIGTEQQSYILNMTKDELLRLKEKIYLTISNSIDFEECAHKLLKLALPDEQLEEMANMLVDCCSQEKTFIKFYGLLAQRFCEIDEKFQLLFFKIFQERYANIFNYEAKRLRNIAKLFAHLFFSKALDWHALQCIILSEDDTTSSSRIFIKVNIIMVLYILFPIIFQNYLSRVLVNLYTIIKMPNILSLF